MALALEEKRGCSISLRMVLLRTFEDFAHEGDRKALVSGIFRANYEFPYTSGP